MTRRVAIAALDGFNEIDVFVALHLVNRVQGLRAELVGPRPRLTSMNGVEVACRELEGDWDAVLVGSGTRTVADWRELDALDLEAGLVGSQCSGAYVLARRGVVSGQVSTDRSTAPLLTELGCTVVPVPLHASGRVATAGGCLSAMHLGAWVIRSLCSDEAARAALLRVAPVGDEDLVERVLATAR